MSPVTGPSKAHLVHKALFLDVLSLSGTLSSFGLLLSAGLLHAHYRSPRSCRRGQHPDVKLQLQWDIKNGAVYAHLGRFVMCDTKKWAFLNPTVTLDSQVRVASVSIDFEWGGINRCPNELWDASVKSWDASKHLKPEIICEAGL